MMFAREPHLTPEKKLWQAVLIVAIRDAMLSVSSQNSRTNKEYADRWLRDCGRDFRVVCTLAGMDPEFVSERYRAGMDLTALRHAI